MADVKQTQGKVVIVSGPSGVGKSTLCREVVRQLGDVTLSLSATTRPPGPGEVDGKDYLFLTDAVFQERVAAGEFLEHAQVFGHWYGTPKASVDADLEAGRSVILEIDIQGGQQAKAVYPEAATIFILPPHSETLAERLDGRGRDNADSAQKRLAEAEHETAVARESYDHMVTNNKLEDAVAEVIRIIQAAPAVSRT